MKKESATVNGVFSKQQDLHLAQTPNLVID